VLPPTTAPPTSGPLPPTEQPHTYAPAPPTYAPAPPAYGPPGYPPPYPYAPPAHPPNPDAHTHSGFFLRLSLGTGFMSDDVSLTDAGYGGGVTAKGPAVSFEVDVGGAIVPGFSLSGSFLLNAIGDSTLSNDTRTFTASGAALTETRFPQTPQVSMLGVMGDVYPNPRQGFHVGGVLGFATMQARRSDDSNGSSGGFALAPHVGYEWWVGDYWGLGVLGRLFYARTRSPYADGRQTDKVVAFTISFSATYN
jgi:hypothetical protein